MLILILIDVWYLQKVVFSFEIGSNGQNCFSSLLESTFIKILMSTFNRILLIEATFIEILNKKQKNLIIGCVYRHHEHEVKV